MLQPREIAGRIESSPALPSGQGDRFAGYAVMGLAFRSGHVLAMRRFAASSVGPGYTSVWHRDPAGVWTFYSTIRPELGCARYFGGEITRNVVVPIAIDWTGPAAFRATAGGDIQWEVTLAQSAASRVLNAAASRVPDAWWQRKFVLEAMGACARFALRAGRINLCGQTPNGHEFVAPARNLWLIASSRAFVHGLDIGAPGALPRQARLRDLYIPQTGIFVEARAILQTRSPVADGLRVFNRKETS